MHTISDTLDEIIRQKTPGNINGQMVDHYTAALIKTVYSKLHENNKTIFSSKSVDEMVAIAYKILTS